MSFAQLTNYSIYYYLLINEGVKGVEGDVGPIGLRGVPGNKGLRGDIEYGDMGYVVA